MRHATKAKNSDDLVTMLDICDTLDINSPPLSAEHIKIIENNIKKKEEGINRLKNSDPWVYGNAVDMDDTKALEVIEKRVLNLYKKNK